MASLRKYCLGTDVGGGENGGRTDGSECSMLVSRAECEDLADRFVVY